jgi:hypothetical protein
MAQDPDAAAERIQRKTQRILWASGLGFVAWQLAYFGTYAQHEGPLRDVDKLRTLGFIAWSAALLFLLATGGGVFAGRRVREILDDELARARRAAAYRNGFWAMMAIAFASYVLAQLAEIGTLHLAHAILSAGVIVAVLTLAVLNRR